MSFESHQVLSEGLCHSSLEIVMRKLLFLEFRNREQCASYMLITIRFQSLKFDLIVDEMKLNFCLGFFPFSLEISYFKT